MTEKFLVDEPDQSLKVERCRVIETQAFKTDGYEISDKFSENKSTDPLAIRTLPELIAHLEKTEASELDARVICVNKEGKREIRKLNKTEFLEHYKKTTIEMTDKFKEAIDSFQYDDGSSGGKVGVDYIPLLGGPFNKQMYIYDYLKMHSTAFHAYHHDPLARNIVNVKRDFTLGRGWQVTSKNPLALALWNAFEEANSLYDIMHYIAAEIEIYGETMIWWLPNHATQIGYQLKPGQEVPQGLIPRIRLIDPSVIWEIVTYPEDITRVLYYQWIAPTQYQIYSGTDKGASVATSKFIYQQVPADQVDHWKVNCVSNEKRGRSGLFPILGYLKRLRDSVNYSIIAMQKAAAWGMDTTIDGSQGDIDAYMDSQRQLGTIAPAGSEFVHSTKVKREYVSNSATSKGGASQSFDWCVSMIAAGSGIPISYLNTHLSGGQTRASALVATEPVTKMFENRQLLYERMMKKMAKRLFKQFGLDAEIEVTFPELVSQDRSAKLKDLALAQTQGWLSNKRAAEISAQELQITEYNYDKEKVDIEDQDVLPTSKTSPLTSPGKVDTPTQSASRSAISGEEKKRLDMANGH